MPETIFEALSQSPELEITCPTCGARTRVDAQFFASRYGLQKRLDELARELVCTACGGGGVSIQPAQRP